MFLKPMYSNQHHHHKNKTKKNIMNTINGKPVETLKIRQKPNGEYEITYTPKFNLITAHHHQIHQKLQEQGLNCQIRKNIQKNYILIFLYETEKAHIILETLNVPHGCYEINKEQKTITIYLKQGKKYRRII